jgi:dethiobiotin synthetase
MSMGCLVTGTDTGVGKTIVAAAIVAALRARGIDAIGLKPVVTGTEEPPAPPWPADHELLAAVSDAPVQEVNFIAYGPPVSPHLAAELSARALDPAVLVSGVQRAIEAHQAVIVEGVGGLLVPLSGSYDLRELAAELGLPLVVVARPGLGTINHTLLTLEAVRSRGLDVAGVVLNPWPSEPDAMLRSNRETIATLGAASVATFASVPGPHPSALAAAGSALPLHEWLGAQMSAPRRLGAGTALS